MDGNTSIDFTLPQFTQREAAEISGADMITINSLVERKYIELTPSQDRRLAGRRYFTVIDIVRISALVELGRTVGLKPQAANQIAASVAHLYNLKRLGLPQTEQGKDCEYWLQCTVDPSPMAEDVASRPGETLWDMRIMFRDPEQKKWRLQSADKGEIYPDQPFIMVPVAMIYDRVVSKCADLLKQDAGHPSGASTQGMDE